MKCYLVTGKGLGLTGALFLCLRHYRGIAECSKKRALRTIPWLNKKNTKIYKKYYTTSDNMIKCKTKGGKQMENKTVEKISIRLKEQDMYNLCIIEDYLFEIAEEKNIDIDNNTTELIRQGLYMAACAIENGLFNKEQP